MAITFVGSAEGSSINGDDVVITLPSMQEDDFVLVVGGHPVETDAAGVSTAGYTEIKDYLHSTGSNHSTVSWKIMGASPDASVTCQGGGTSSSGVAYVAMVFRGVDLTTPIDAATTDADGGSGAPDSPSITTVNGGAVVTFGQSRAADTSVTAPTGYGDQFDIDANDLGDVTTMAAWKTVAAATAENPDAWTNVTSAVWSAHSIALRAAAVGGGAVTATFGYIF